ncbi:hypothetical protein BD779DRAFT_1791775 [Infundibulicybe gibba]|nr:hypothetical protein BD779DRAFT_1791775 [Infundibulicybe gibba]
MHPSQLVACGLPELDIGSSSTASWWKIMMITLGPVAHCYSNAKFSRVFNFNVNSATNDLLGFVEYTSSGVRFGEGSVAAGVKNSYESVLTATTPITWLLAYGTCQRTVAIDRLTDSEALGILTKSRLKQGNSTPWGEPDLTVKSGNDSSQNPSGPSSAVIRIKAGKSASLDESQGRESRRHERAKRPREKSRMVSGAGAIAFEEQEVLRGKEASTKATVSTRPPPSMSGRPKLVNSHGCVQKKTRNPTTAVY